MDKARLELPAGCVVALLVLLLLILVLAGVMALRSRPAHPLATDPTHSVFRYIHLSHVALNRNYEMVSLTSVPCTSNIKEYYSSLVQSEHVQNTE